jgi:putative membrane-bound dehydrogenase-like protein
MKSVFVFGLAIVVFMQFVQVNFAEDFVPRRQAKVPGPALSPAEAIKKFTVPDGFRVELVAAEPDIMNPVAMAFDDRGRIYVTESFEYPRREAGPGRDRIKILEDTNNDGIMDKVTVFAEGLNIPSGIAVGHGGVWVANAPDLLFIEDTDGDDVSDKQTVIVTGFGRDDVHEVPSGLTWGPDGCLYGLNGVFNPSRIIQDGKVWDFTCAIWRVDPKTRKFDLFCEGTSNPWGIAFDSEGSAFVSACVIDHLWHLSETGYYHRQGGPYPTHTWKAESIVKHKHQMAAYCGIEYVDSPVYPSSYNDKLYMGNIHGTCINSDRVVRKGATYEGFPEPDFMTADDVWFMPVCEKMGPDGCLYVLDWYDRYHCYQDANADPKGVDRGLGRLYRVTYGDKPKPPIVDISKLSNDLLLQELRSPNIYHRQRAQLEIAERSVATTDIAFAEKLASMSIDMSIASKFRMHAAWSLSGSGPVAESTLNSWLTSKDPLLRAWGVRTIGRMQQTLAVAPENKVADRTIDTAISLASDSDPRVRIEVAIAAAKIDPSRVTATMISILDHSVEDAILSRVVWQNWYPRLKEDQSQVLAAFERASLTKDALLFSLAPRIAGVWLSSVKPTIETSEDQKLIKAVLQLAALVREKSPDEAAATIDSIIVKAQNNELRGDIFSTTINTWFQGKNFSADSQAKLATGFVASITGAAQDSSSWGQSIQQLKMAIGDSEAIAHAEAIILDPTKPAAMRKSLLKTVAQKSPDTISKSLLHLLNQLEKKNAVDTGLRDTILDLGISRARDHDTVLLIEKLPTLDPGIQATIAERMSQRGATALPLLNEILAGRFRKELVGPNQVRSLAGNTLPAVTDAVRKIWGTVNTKGSGQRQKVVREYGNFLKWDARGDAKKGLVVYDRICGQCHVMHGRGYEVGPNITSNGRGSFEQLIVSVFDPSLVIGEAYKSITVLTTDGLVMTGLLVEKTDQRVVLKLQGNKLETISIEDIDEIKQNEKSLMPEGIEEQMTRQEMADLFALLSLEGPHDAAQNTTISGTPDALHKNK